jgi:multidrug efflux pump subunit AcrB
MGEYASSNAKGSRTARLAARMQAIYRVPLRWTVRHPLLTVGLVTAAFAGVLGLARTMPFQVNAPAKPFDLQVHFETMPGVDRAHTKAQGEAIDALVRERLGDNIRSTTLRVGSYLDQQRGRLRTGANIGNLRWEFDYDEAFRDDYVETVRELRMVLATNPELGSYQVAEKQAGPPAGAAITANVRGRDIDEINRAVAEIKAVLYGMDGVSGIRDTYGAGKETFRVRVDPDRAARFGLTEREVANAVRAAIDGLTALEVSIDEEQVEIVVRYAEGRSRGKQRLRDLVIATPGGDFVRLDQVAQLQRTREVGFVVREDGMRTVAVEADLDTEVSSPLAAAALLEERWNAELAPRYPGLELTFGGESDELVKSLEDLPGLFLLAMITIYMVLALQFKSYLQPVIILAAVPFGLMGAVCGLAALGYDLTIFAMFGMVALAGIVVNDSLVMIDFINSRRRDEGMSVTDAAIEGATHRLRPILCTTLTTVGGLLPMAIGLGGRDDVLAPMAVAISGGLAVSTALVLLVVPAIFVIVERLRSRGKT